MRRGAPLNQPGYTYVASGLDLEGSAPPPPSTSDSGAAKKDDDKQQPSSAIIPPVPPVFQMPSAESMTIGAGPVIAGSSIPPSSGGGSAAAFSAYADAANASFLRMTVAGLIAGSFVLSFVLSAESRIILFVTVCCIFGYIYSFQLSRSVLRCDDGTPEMRAVSDPIKEGAEGFLAVQYAAIARIAVPLTGLIWFSYMFRPDYSEIDGARGIATLGNSTLGVVSGLGFVFGAVCSGVSGYVSMWVASKSNIRVCSAARRSYGEALVVCFRGGAFSAVLNISLCVTGVMALYLMIFAVFVRNNGDMEHRDIPMLMVGYGFGASFVALFMQLGGGIYTKAADVGADLVGKVEQGIPEDDPRNPAVIADLVGDMVGDCVGSSADVFESVAAEIIAAMILASTLAKEAGFDETVATKFVFFPLVVHGMDIVVSSLGIMVVGMVGSSPDSNPMTTLTKGYRAALVLAVAGFYIITSSLLHNPEFSDASFKYFLCGITGIACAFVIVCSTQYYTDYEYSPVQSIAEASTTGHGTNIIVGISVGMKATLIPTVAVAFAVLTAYHLGSSTGIGDGHNAGLFGTAVATMGMLSNAVYILSMNNYGPIADNAGGIAEMSLQPEHVRDATDRLDAAGNVTKAVTKGYSIGSASMACFLLFGAFMDEFSEFSGLPFKTVDISTPEVLVGGLLGSMIIFYFTGLAISAVGRTAHDVVMEVRRQFRENPGIMTFQTKPDHSRCVSLVTKAALREMQFPGLVCVLTPIAVGLIFRFVGESTNRPLLGAEVLASYLMFGTVTGILMALFLDTTGGAWDNAKKFIELGNFGGKNSEAHKASITGDTVGDPFKDTAGPSLHVVIKLLSTTILVAGPLFVANMNK
uniref:H(+)-exporting diphosphatase n=1 Tax=Corethron hystrix TaxID=216773 RepID=A0A7S1BBD8_9STRA|mmetsp:Transcript_2057/g.4111  ORF Transcript_2057/g.4111 Transcript_2057/m.4111 type:complete len:866 (+) Transcript_2057:63-2660(+)